MSLKAYETPNLISLNGVSITSDTSISLPSFEAVNLIQNLETRSSGNNYYPKNSLGNLVTYESCFKTTQNELAANDHQLVLGLDFGRSFFQHAILIV